MSVSATSTITCPSCGGSIVVDLEAGPMLSTGDHVAVELKGRPRPHLCLER